MALLCAKTDAQQTTAKRAFMQMTCTSVSSLQHSLYLAGEESCGQPSHLNDWGRLPPRRHVERLDGASVGLPLPALRTNRDAQGHSWRRLVVKPIPFEVILPHRQLKARAS